MLSLSFRSSLWLRAARPFVVGLLCAVVAPAPSATAAPPGAISLESVLEDVAARNPTLASRRAMVAAATERGRMAGAWESPTLEVGVVNLPTSGGFDDEMTMKMVGVTQRVPVFGAKGLQRRAEGETAEAVRATSVQAQFELFGEAVEAYADAYYALESAGEAARHESGIGRFTEAARARYRAGNGRLQDVLRAEAEGARVRADVVRFQSDALVALAHLDALRVQDAQGALPTLNAPPALTIPDAPTSWIAAATEGHPRIREAEARQRSYDFSARAERRSVWPDLELRASYGQRGRDAMGMDLNDMVSATIGFTLPIFSGSSVGAKADEMTAMGRVAAAERDEAALELSRKARTLHAEATAASRMVALLADTVVVTESKAVEASWSAFTAGTTDLYRVIDSSHALYAEALELLEARRALARVQAELIALTGRGDLAGVELPEIRRDEP